MSLDLERPKRVRAVFDILEHNPRDTRAVAHVLGIKRSWELYEALSAHDDNTCTQDDWCRYKPCLHSLWDIASDITDRFGSDMPLSTRDARKERVAQDVGNWLVRQCTCCNDECDCGCVDVCPLHAGTIDGDGCPICHGGTGHRCGAHFG